MKNLTTIWSLICQVIQFVVQMFNNSFQKCYDGIKTIEWINNLYSYLVSNYIFEHRNYLKSENNCVVNLNDRNCTEKRLKRILSLICNIPSLVGYIWLNFWSIVIFQKKQKKQTSKATSHLNLSRHSYWASTSIWIWKSQEIIFVNSLL